MKHHIIKYAPFALFLLFIPYFFDFYPINLEGDVSRMLMRVLALADSHFSFNMDSTSLYVNPITHLIKNVHGAWRSILLFPIFYIVDILGIRITEISVNAVYVIVGFVLTIINYLFLAKCIGKRKALMFAFLLSVIPYYVMQIKASWWMNYYYPFFFAGLWFLYKYFQSSERKWYAYFCVSAALLIFSTPDFFFSGVFFILYMFIHGYIEKDGLKGGWTFFYKTISSFWTIIPVATILFLTAFSYTAYKLFGGEYGIMAHLFLKGAIPKYYHPGALIHLGVHGIGLLGFVFFPVIFLALGKIFSQWKKHKKNVLLVTAVFYFFAVWVMFLLAGGITGAMVGLFIFPGGLFILYALDSLRLSQKIKIILFSLLIITTYTQTLLYQKGYEPTGTFLTKTGWVPFPRSCDALWCPYLNGSYRGLFGTDRNLGIKTLGYVARDYLEVSPKEFESREKSQEYGEDFLFHSGFGYGPVSHIGRRISDSLGQSNGMPSVIAQFTEEFLLKYPGIVLIEEYQKVDDFIYQNDRYTKVAIITKEGIPFINVYQLDSQRELKIFEVEYYDKIFDKEYATLEHLGKIDLGS